MQEATEEPKNPPMLEINGQGAVTPDRFKFFGVPGSECLTQGSAPVAEYDDRLQSLVDTLRCTAYFYEALGISAPQIGVLQRVFVAKINGEYKEFVNPVLIDSDGETKELEGCVSFPQVLARVSRYGDVVVQAHDSLGTVFTLALDGMESVCVQHEIDHLDGILFIDRMSPLYKRQTIKKTNKTLHRFGLKK